MIKNKPSLCDVFDIIREMMWKLLKKSVLARQELVRMNAKNTSKAFVGFVLHTGLWVVN